MLRTGVIWKSGVVITNRSGWLLELLTELINFNPLTARWGRAYDYKSQIPCNAYSGQRLVTAFMSHRPPRRRAFLIQNFSDCATVQSCHFIQIFSRVQLEKAPFSDPRRKVWFLDHIDNPLGILPLLPLTIFIQFLRFPWRYFLCPDVCGPRPANLRIFIQSSWGREQVTEITGVSFV